jgi:hypothetical protein
MASERQVMESRTQAVIYEDLKQKQVQGPSQYNNREPMHSEKNCTLQPWLKLSPSPEY